MANIFMHDSLFKFWDTPVKRKTSMTNKLLFDLGNYTKVWISDYKDYGIKGDELGEFLLWCNNSLDGIVVIQHVVDTTYPYCLIYLSNKSDLVMLKLSKWNEMIRIEK